MYSHEGLHVAIIIASCIQTLSVYTGTVFFTFKRICTVQQLFCFHSQLMYTFPPRTSLYIITATVFCFAIS